MEFIYDIYTLRIIEDDEDGYDIDLFNTEEMDNPLIYLKLKPLWEISFEYDDKLQVRDIPRNLFNIGEYYQSATFRHTNSEQYNGISLLSIIHNSILENHELIPEISAIYSSSFNEYEEENFFSIEARDFWEKQLEKAPELPVSLFEEDKRYKFDLTQ